MAAWQAWCRVGVGGAGQKEVVEGEAEGPCSSVNPSTRSTSTAKSLLGAGHNIPSIQCLIKGRRNYLVT